MLRDGRICSKNKNHFRNNSIDGPQRHSRQAKGAPYSAGKFTWSIPQLYKAGTKTKQIKVLDHIKEITMTGGKATLSIAKNGASNQVSEP